MIEGKKMSIGKNPVVILLLAAALVITLPGCQTLPEERPPRTVERAGWSEYIRVPHKDFVVVGVLVLRQTNPLTLSADLMEKAASIGAHDIINVRVDREHLVDGRLVVAASAIAIRYTEETLRATTSTVTQRDAQGTTTTTTITGSGMEYSSAPGATSATGGAAQGAPATQQEAPDRGLMGVGRR